MRRLVLAVCVAALVTPAWAAPRKADVYLLTGQSNMSGRGLLEELTAEERVADPAIRLYGNDGVTRPALDPLDDPAGQVDAVSRSAGRGDGRAATAGVPVGVLSASNNRSSPRKRGPKPS